MNTKTNHPALVRIMSLVLSLFILCGVSVAGTVSVSAANSTIKVQIANVVRRYSEAKDFLGMINDYRKEKGADPLVMDKTYLENAMIRAAELSLYVSYTSPNGKSGNQYITGVSDGGQIIGYDVRSMKALLYDFQQNAISDSLILGSQYHSVGVGVVNVSGYKFVALLISTKNATPVADSILSQSGVSLNQEIETQTSVISEISPAYSNGASVICGSTLQANVKVKNKGYPTVSVFLTSYGATVTLTDTTVFQYLSAESRVKAVKPGTCTMSIMYGNDVSLRVSSQLTAIGKNFSTTSVDIIPDQIYTGKEIRPLPVIKDANGQKLVLGTDYTLTYANNINVGTATINIVGKNDYEGQTKAVTFRIISSGSGTYLKLTVMTSNPEITLGQSVKITSIPSGGTAPIKYTYDYSIAGTNQWKTIASKTTAATVNFKPLEAQIYYIQVSAEDAAGLGSTQTAVVIVSKAITLNAGVAPASPTVGGTITLNAASTGGTGTVQYAYFVKPPSAADYKTIKSYSTAASVAYHPTEKGSYQFCIKAKDKNEIVSKQYFTVKVTASTLVNKSSVSKTIIDLGETIALYGASSGGATPASYAYFYKKDSEKVWHTIKNYSVSAKVTLKPQAAKKYNICIKVKDANGNVEKKYFNLTVNPKLTNDSTANTTTVAAGKSVSITCKASGGTAPYQYAVYYLKPNTTNYLKSSDYGTSTSRSVKLVTKGKNLIRVKVKDAQGIVVNKDFTITVT